MRLPALLAAGLVVGTAALLPASAAVPASAPPTATPRALAACASPTRTLTGGSSDVITLAADETLLLTGGAYTGGVTDFPQGSTLCVSASASFSPPYANNAAGTLAVEGTATLPWLTVSSGFQLVNEGTTAAQGVITGGTARLTNTADGTLDLPNGLALGNQSVLDNAGTATVGSLNVSAGSAVTNTGTLAAGGSGTALDGEIDNSGKMTVQQYLTASAGSVLHNTCTLAVSAGWATGGTATNEGLITLGSDYLNNTGTITQSTAGQISGVDFTNASAASITGFGDYRFTDNTTNFGTFNGDSANDPIVFHDTTQTGSGIFDTSSGTVTNTVRAPVVIDPATTPAGCGNRPTDKSADLHAYKTGPANAATGDRVTYVVVVANRGPDAAADVTVTDQLPSSGLTDLSASDGGTVTGTTATWPHAEIPANSAVTYTVTGTTTTAGTLLDVVSATSTTTDPDATNNDGSAPSARVTTTVTDSVPMNNPPVIDDQAFTTDVNRTAYGRLVATDPDTGQTLTYSLPAALTKGAMFLATANGSVTLTPDGHFAFTPTTDFTGRDTFAVRVCDNGTPVLCDRALVTVTVLPVAVDDTVRAESGIPATGNVKLNDRGDTGPPVATSQPSHGTLTQLPSGDFRYVSDPGFTGTDSFTYRICSPTAPDVCSEATVTITVVERRWPPVVGDVHQETYVNEPVSGRVPVSDRQGLPVTTRLGSPPAHGTATVTAQGTFVYRPAPGFTGTDTFTVIGSDNGTPPLCDTGTVTVVVRPRPSPSPTPTPTPTPHPTPPSPSPTTPTVPTPPAGGGTGTGAGGGTPQLPATGAGFTELLAGTALLAALCGAVTLTLARRSR
ncbi:Ig-like domain-containing protein [Streptomyces sp. NBC_01465]|uniref:Ig-like domain-containing protein n=1 Tax=Streptomyces sp. NBC_01465 TaxID=2903878 RepID=UPI002E2F3474|nr:Ig-like domain-containing protein [Streptomyces sp. NBC_01465]